LSIACAPASARFSRLLLPCENTEAIFKGEFVRTLNREIQQRAREKLKYLDSAFDLRDLMIPPSINLKR
jgi:plasmid maintenance system killer protein